MLECANFCVKGGTNKNVFIACICIKKFQKGIIETNRNIYLGVEEGLGDRGERNFLTLSVGVKKETNSTFVI